MGVNQVTLIHTMSMTFASWEFSRNSNYNYTEQQETDWTGWGITEEHGNCASSH